MPRPATVVDLHGTPAANFRGTVRSAPPHATARLRVVRGEAGSRLADLHQQGALRVLRPRPPAGESFTAVLANTSGGIVGGDRLEVRAEVGAGASALITTQAAEKSYRSAGPDARSDVSLHLADRAWLEWLPQETILFDGARLRRALCIDLARQARLIGGDVLVFGRRASGERFRTGLLNDRWEVRVDGRLAWADVLRLDTPEAQIEAPFGFAGAGAYGMCIYVAPDAADRLVLARHLTELSGLRAAATLVGPVLIVRWLGAEPAAVRAALRHFWTAFRHAVRDLPAAMPAIWRI